VTPPVVGFNVHEVQRVGGDQVGIALLPGAVEQKVQPAARVNAKMSVTFRTNVQIFFQLFFPNDLAAIFTPRPKTLGADVLFFTLFQFRRFPLKPAHL
jgi:hypothetical protein